MVGPEAGTPSAYTLFFVLTFIWVIEGEKDNLPFVDLLPKKARRQKLHPGLPRRRRCSTTWAILCCLPRPSAGAGREVGQPGLCSFALQVPPLGAWRDPHGCQTVPPGEGAVLTASQGNVTDKGPASLDMVESYPA